MNDLYRGILTQLKIVTECCSKRKETLKLEALSYFSKSVRESGNECSLEHFSIGDSIYKGIERLYSLMNSELTTSHSCNGNFEHNSLLLEGCDINAPCDNPNEIDGVPEEMKPDDLNVYIANTFHHLVELAAMTTFILTRMLCSAYLENFYYNALQDYKLTSDVCDTIFSFFESHKCISKNSERAFPLFLTNE